ncbi:metal ABC transporter ATP-binding protein [Acetobacter orleanensis]|uniref:ABC transporter ATP-binding protein n=1 Tax=Acetobacter orleanensis TaxID=104099 RepID=A0A4Y3TLQ4_9PROT|nr:ATP-binding cassette domain-containing protein [Acetobacter orleanensis]PCD80117.1 iron transporter [Acetobacter orleanensis]GAN68461.1 ABC transporter Mn2+/Zn2+ permease [Acetobacter orleanensis JCM 7639]GBR22828.1 Mn2+/Zn2+ transporter ATP-binding protein [Acetobacter orleanensis NRIC 0473]GEB82694.1 ABC transporter ATP-binding protein [Acetobacter orleanensis]
MTAADSTPPECVPSPHAARTSHPAASDLRRGADSICLKEVTLARGGRIVLSEISLAIPQGSFVGVLGANGAGKTTLFHALLGLEPTMRGSLSINGQPVRRGNRSVGYMPQMRKLTGGQFTGWSMVASALHGQRWGLPWYGRAARAAVEAALAAVDAQSLAHRPVGTLSGGERQRLLLAQTLLDNPSVLLLDEPLASLDPARMRETVARIHALARARGMTVLMSAHDINPLLGLMDHVLYLARGRALLGTVEQVITTEALTALYGAPVDVVRAGGRVFVVAEGGGSVLQEHDCGGCGVHA